MPGGRHRQEGWLAGWVLLGARAMSKVSFRALVMASRLSQSPPARSPVKSQCGGWGAKPALRSTRRGDVGRLPAERLAIPPSGSMGSAASRGFGQPPAFAAGPTSPCQDITEGCPATRRPHLSWVTEGRRQGTDPAPTLLAAAGERSRFWQEPLSPHPAPPGTEPLKVLPPWPWWEQRGGSSRLTHK